MVIYDFLLLGGASHSMQVEFNMNSKTRSESQINLQYLNSYQMTLSQAQNFIEKLGCLLHSPSFVNVVNQAYGG